ncbi:MAG: plastocyanin/azurin family copper-binding protein [Balneolales bacterium]
MKQVTRNGRWSGILGLFAMAAAGYLTGAADARPALSDDALPGATSVTVAHGDTVVIQSQGSDLSYDVTEIRAHAGDTITIRYQNPSDMPHNVVLVKGESDINPVGIAALQAYASDYIPEAEMDRIIGYTNLALPGDTVYVTFAVPGPGSYPYMCSYPGHFTSMQGRLISRE